MISLTCNKEINANNIMQYITDAKNWKKTKKNKYNVWLSIPKPGQKVYNFLEGAKYETKEDRGCVLSGTVGEQWVTGVGNVAKMYTWEDGSPINNDTLKVKLNKDGTLDWHLISTKQTDAYNYCFHLPMSVHNFPIKTSWGETLLANRDGIEHGQGDFILCSLNADGSPNLNDLLVVNGRVFINTYNKKAIPGLKADGKGTKDIPKPSKFTVLEKDNSENNIKYQAVGKIERGTETIGYKLKQLSNGEIKQFTRDQVIYLVGRNQVENLEGQLYKDKVLLRGADTLASEKIAIDNVIVLAKYLIDEFANINIRCKLDKSDKKYSITGGLKLCNKKDSSSEGVQLVRFTIDAQLDKDNMQLVINKNDANIGDKQLKLTKANAKSIVNSVKKLMYREVKDLRSELDSSGNKVLASSYFINTVEKEDCKESLYYGKVNNNGISVKSFFGIVNSEVQEEKSLDISSKMADTLATVTKANIKVSKKNTGYALQGGVVYSVGENISTVYIDGTCYKNGKCTFHIKAKANNKVLWKVDYVPKADEDAKEKLKSTMAILRRNCKKLEGEAQSVLSLQDLEKLMSSGWIQYVGKPKQSKVSKEKKEQ